METQSGRAPRAYTITRDGETLARTLTEVDAIYWLHTHQPQSVEWAMRHEGYDIVTPDGESLAGR